MLSSYFNCLSYPPAIASHADWFTKDGLILWKKMWFSRMEFKERVYTRNDVLIRDSLRDPRKAVLLNVNDGTHWVVGLSKSLWSNDYVCLDPWTGQKCLAMRSYRNIVGSSHFAAIQPLKRNFRLMAWLVPKPLSEKDKLAFTLHTNHIRDHADPRNVILYNFCKRNGIEMDEFIRRVKNKYWNEYENEMKKRQLI